MPMQQMLFMVKKAGGLLDDYRPLDILGDGSCLARYKMDDNVNDESTNYNASSTSNISWVAGMKNKAGDFNGNASAALPTIKNSYPFTMSCWVTSDGNWDMGNNHRQVMNTSIGSQRCSLSFLDGQTNWIEGVYIMYGGSGHWAGHSLNSVMGGGGSTNTKSNLSKELLGDEFHTGDKAWFHVVYAVNSSNSSDSRVYINGFDVGLVNMGGGHGGSGGWNMGSNSASGEYWDGKIENVRFFNKQLTAAEAWTCTQEFFPSGSKDTIVKDRLRLYYDFSNSACYSGSGQVNNLSDDVSGWAADVNGATYGGTGNAKYFEFDGSNDRLEIGSAAGQDAAWGMQNRSYTLEAWCYHLAAPSNVIGGIISSQEDASPNKGASINLDTRSAHGGGPNGYHHQMSKNGSWTTTGTNGNTGSGTGSVSNRWDHVVATFNGAIKRVYENGSELGSQGTWDLDHDDVVTLSGTYWAIGCQSQGSSFSTRYYDGRIAIVRIYDAALSSAQVLHHYNLEKSRFGL